MHSGTAALAAFSGKTGFSADHECATRRRNRGAIAQSQCEDRIKPYCWYRRIAAGKDEPTIDAKGLVLAPGFIDIHNHSTDELQSDPLAESQISQGITTLVVGADGESPWPLITWIRSIQQNPASLNVGIFAGACNYPRTGDGQRFQAARQS